MIILLKNRRNIFDFIDYYFQRGILDWRKKSYEQAGTDTYIF